MLLPVRYPDTPEGLYIGSLKVSIIDGQWWYLPEYADPTEFTRETLPAAPSEGAGRLLVVTAFLGSKTRLALAKLVHDLALEQGYLQNTLALRIGDANYDRLQARAEAVGDLYRALQYLDL